MKRYRQLTTIEGESLSLPKGGDPYLAIQYQWSAVKSYNTRMLKGFRRLYLSIYSYIRYDILDTGNSFHGFCRVGHMTRKVSYIVGETYFSCFPKLSHLQDQALAERAQPTSWAC